MEDKIVAFMRSCGIAYTIRGLGRSIVEINEAFFAAKIPLVTNILDIYAEEPGSSLKASCALIEKNVLQIMIQDRLNGVGFRQIYVYARLPPLRDGFRVKNPTRTCAV